MNDIATQFHAAQVLVVGGGGAGIRAAIAAAEQGAETLLVVNDKLLSSGSTFYKLSPGWGIMSARDVKDVQPFYEDILAAADGCLDERLVRIMCEQSAEVVEDLKRYGVQFWPLGKLGMTPCFGKAPRGQLLQDLSQFKRQMGKKLRSLGQIRVIEDVSVVSLMVRDGVCDGAIGFDKEGAMHVFSADATVLSSGGAQNLYQYAYRNGTNNGAAYAMAARHGARVVNLEFVQFINAALSPKAGINYYQFLFRTLPGVRNANGERFLEKYLPEGLMEETLLKLRATHGPFSVADDACHFDLAIVRESERIGAAGATISPDAEQLAGLMYKPWRHCLKEMEYALDTPMTIYPHCHAFNGGVLISPDMTTDIPGLYACGEAAGGYHGANRIGGNSMLGTQVFGKLAGNIATSFPRRGSPQVTKDEALKLLQDDCGTFTGAGDKKPNAVMDTVQDVMQRYGFLMRCGKGLDEGLMRLEQCCETFEPARWLGTQQARSALDAYNALCAARLILTAMRERKESRGGHYRTDYPLKDETRRTMQSITCGGGEVRSHYIGQITPEGK